MSSHAYLAAVPIPLVLIDSNGRLEAVNDAATALLGSASLGRSYVLLLRQPALTRLIEACLSDATVAETHIELSRRDHIETYRVQVAPIKTDHGRCVLVSFLDVTELQAAEQSRRDFVANVSHELKTPLTALIGFIETLSGSARNDPKASDRFLGIMEREAQRMNRLVSDLLSLSRVEEDSRVRPKDRVAPAALVQTTLTALQPTIKQLEASVVFDPGELAEFEVPGDADQLVQVFTNLIENALKYGGGVVEVTVARGVASVQFPTEPLVITVQNDGEGIDALHIPRLTERFYRADSHRSREMGGTGLGLAITKHIVNRHRGRLTIKSTPGEGVTVCVHLPVV